MSVERSEVNSPKSNEPDSILEHSSSLGEEFADMQFHHTRRGIRDGVSSMFDKKEFVSLGRYLRNNSLSEAESRHFWDTIRLVDPQEEFALYKKLYTRVFPESHMQFDLATQLVMEKDTPNQYERRPDRTKYTIKRAFYQAIAHHSDNPYWERVKNQHYKEETNEVEEVRADLTEKLMHGLDTKDAKQYLAPLAEINPQRLLTLFGEGELPESLHKQALDSLARYAPEETIIAATRGLIPMGEVKSRINVIAEYEPIVMLRHLKTIPFDDAEQVQKKIAEKCSEHVDIEVFMEMLENNEYLSEFLSPYLPSMLPVIEKRIHEEVSGENDPAEKRKDIERYLQFAPLRESLVIGKEAFDLQEQILGTDLQQRMQDKIASLNQSPESAQDIYSSSEANAHFSLEELAIKHNLPIADVQKHAALYIAEHAQHDDLLEIGWYLVSNSSAYEKQKLMGAILDNPAAGANGYLMLGRIVSESISHKQKDTLITYVKSRLRHIHTQSGDKDEREAELSSLVNFALTLNSRVDDEQLREQIVKAIALSEEQLDSFAYAMDYDVDGSKHFFSSLKRHQQEDLIGASEGISQLKLFGALPMHKMRQNKELFEEVKKSNDYVQGFNHYEEFLAFRSLDIHIDSGEQLKALFTVRDAIGHTRWKSFLKKTTPESLINLHKNGLLGTEKEPTDIDVLMASYANIFGHESFSATDLEFITRTYNDKKEKEFLEASLEPFLPSEPKRKKKARVPENGESVDKLQQMYTLLKWQQFKTGMTKDQIGDIMDRINDYDSNQLQLDGFMHSVFWGDNLKILYDRRDTIFTVLQENRASSYTELNDVLDSSDLETSIDFILKNASALSSSKTEWERMADLAIDLAFAELHGTELLLDGKFTPSSDEVREQLRGKMSQRLRSIIETSQADKQQATKRNMQLAELIRRKGSQFEIPPDSLIHTTQTKYLPEIIAKGNLAGECLGKLEKGTDSYPGYVDLQQLDETWDRKFNNKQSDRFGSGSYLVYIPGTVQEPMFDVTERSGYKGHRLVLAGMSPAELSLVVMDSDELTEIDKQKEACVRAGIYVPIVFQDTGELLYSPEEFEEDIRIAKDFTDIEAMVTSETVYSEELLTTPNSNPVATIAEHMQRVYLEAKQMLHQTDLPSEIQLLVQAAAKLHDVGKTKEQIQEFANVSEAAEILDSIVDINSEQKRKILLMIKYDELLGQVLMNTHETEDGEGDFYVTKEGEKKLEQFEKIFEDEALKAALLVLYQADVSGIGGDEYEQWQVAEKLAFLNLPVFERPLPAAAAATTEASA